MNVRLDKQLKGTVIGSAEDVYPIMQRILMRESRTDRNREHFWTVSLDTAGTLVNIELVSMGSVRQTVVEPMEVYSIPLQKRAVRLILVHNHPGGTLKPGDADKDITDQLIQAGRILKVQVLDHLIITETGYYSFADSGLLKELENSTKYVPAYELKRRYEAEAKLLAKEQVKAAEEHIIETREKNIARAMKRNGEPLEKIMEYTGLSKAVIGRLKV